MAGCGAPTRKANHNPAPYVQTHLTPIRIDDFKQNDTFITSNYVWKYANIEWHWELQIPTGLVTYFQNLSRPIVDGFNYSVYIIHSSDDYLINIMASEILKVSRLHGFSNKETIEFASSFVQAIPNSPDSTTGFDEYPRYPVETLVDITGDCEDSAILLGSLLQSMGKELVLVSFPDGDDLFGTHWVHNGEKYFYIETTSPNNTIGEIPNLFAHLPVIIYDIPTLPS